MSDRSPDDELPGHGTKPFLAHLEDLRLAMLWSVAALAAGMAVILPLAPLVLGWLQRPLAAAGIDPAEFLKVIRVTGGLSITLRIVLWAGILVALPFILVAVGWFVFPGLKRRERRAILRALWFAVGLFAAGVASGYFLVLPPVLRLMVRINAWLGITCDFVELGDYVAFVLRLLIAFGLAYELPVVVVVLGALGIVTSSALRQARRYVIVGLFIVAMLLTPPDPLSQVLMALPLTLLYELCVWIVYWRER